MWRAIILASAASSLVSTVGAQVKKQFSVEKTASCARVELKLTAKTGNCFIRPSHSEDILNVYSNQDLEEYSHSFTNEVTPQACKVALSLEQQNQRGVSQNISYRFFGSEAKPSDKFWKVYLTESTPYVLDLDYGLGNANIDLSGLSIEKLKINTVSADVHIGYNSGIENKVTMDTFYVKVDMGSLHARHLNLAKAHVIVADVGFGNMFLDLGNTALVNNKVIGRVGAGNLVIQLPAKEVPVLVTVNESWLCSLNLSPSLKKIAPNQYANAAYSADSKNALTFNLDVSMGKIVFKEKSN